MAVLLILAVILTPAAELLAASYMLSYVNNEDASYIPAYMYDPTAPDLPANFRAYNSGKKNLTGFWYISVSSYRDTPCYCIDILNSRTQGGVEWSSTSTPPRALDQEQRNLLAYVLSHGYTAGWKGAQTDFAFQVATQIAVWLITTGDYKDPSSVDAVCSGFAPNASIGAKAKELVEESLVAFTIPSFTSYSADTAPSYQMHWDEETEEYTLTLTDTNEVLSSWDFESSTIDGCSISRQDNTLIINGFPTLNSTSISRYKTTGNLKMARLLFLTYNNYQSLTYSTAFVNEPVTSIFKITAEKPSITISKSSDDGIVSGMSFEITKPGDDAFAPVTVITGDDGIAGPVELFPGRYVITEKDVPERYIAPAEQTADLTESDHVTLEFENRNRKVMISKESEDGVVEGMSFRVTCEELGFDSTVATDSEGRWTISGLLPGRYTIEEVDVPDRYVPMEPVTIDVTYETEVYPVTCVNRIKKGYVSLRKTSSYDGKGLQGAIYTVYDDTDTPVGEMTTGTDGTARSEELLYGSYYLLESSPPRGHLPNSEKHYFNISEDGVTINISAVDDPRVGRVYVSWNGHGSNVDTSDSVNLSVLYFSLIYLSLIILFISVKKLNKLKH